MAGIMIAAPRSGSGKTMVTCGLLVLLERKGFRPAAFKCGPDYIDGLFHRKVLGVESGNLDSFFEEPEHMREKISQAGKDRFVVVEGVMGYFDGLGGVSVKSSSWEVAQILSLPVILVIDAKGASLSLLAQIQGFLEYIPRDENGEKITGKNRIAGILLNRVSPMIYGRIKALAEEQFGIPVVGYVPELDFLKVGSRHLGLILPDEIDGLKAQMEQLADCMEQTIDLETLAAVGGYEMAQTGTAAISMPYGAEGDRSVSSNARFTLGVAMDEAFCFYYRDNLDAMEQAGARLVYFSPLHDPEIPKDADGLLFGGGYPENYAKELSGRAMMRRSISDAARRGMPILGECGGYLYLLDLLQGTDKTDYAMAGVLSGRGFRSAKKGRFGYITLCADETLPYLPSGMEIRGHEFHYWDCECRGEEYRMTARKPVGGRSWPCMRVSGRVMAGFPHLYYPSCPEFVSRFAEHCISFGKEVGHDI